MNPAATVSFREQLLDRQRRLRDALTTAPDAGDLFLLLREVDSALARVEASDFGRCDLCHEQVEEDFLRANPLIQYCLCSLSPEQQSALEKDLGLAGRIQRALLPPQDLCWAGWETHFRYRPAGPVSGDYCDLVPRENGTAEVYFAVGDVSGKGVAAALLMAHLNAAFRSLIGVGLALPELVRQANDLLATSTIRSHYATLLAGRADAAGCVELCNAGHCTPILLRRDGSILLESPHDGGPPVGIFSGQPYEARHALLDPGDALFLYTDGVTEQRNAGGDEYGLDRLTAILARSRPASPGRLADAVLRDLERFRDGRPTDDDVSLLVLQRRDSSA